MSRPGIEPVTSRSSERTFYQLSYRGRFACSATGYGDLKFITDSLPLFGLNETFLIANDPTRLSYEAVPCHMKCTNS